MPNFLDQFIEAGNQHARGIMSDSFTWNGSTYLGTISDLQKDEFWSDEGTGKKRETERLLEVNVSEFGSSIPQINDTILYLNIKYELVSVESEDTTNIVWKIRQQIKGA